METLEQYIINECKEFKKQVKDLTKELEQAKNTVEEVVYDLEMALDIIGKAKFDGETYNQYITDYSNEIVIDKIKRLNKKYKIFKLEAGEEDGIQM